VWESWIQQPEVLTFIGRGLLKKERQQRRKKEIMEVAYNSWYLRLTNRNPKTDVGIM
jgi:hypothetical protein